MWTIALLKANVIAEFKINKKRTLGYTYVERLSLREFCVAIGLEFFLTANLFPSLILVWVQKVVEISVPRSRLSKLIR